MRLALLLLSAISLSLGMGERYEASIHLVQPLVGARVQPDEALLRISGHTTAFSIGDTQEHDGYLCVVLNYVTEWCGYQTGTNSTTQFDIKLDVKPFLLQWVQPHESVVTSTMAQSKLDEPASPRHPLRAYPLIVSVELRAHAQHVQAISPSRLVWCQPVQEPESEEDLSDGESEASLKRKGNWMPGALDLDQINVALHAQSKYKQHGFVAGSEVTTAGIAQALSQTPGIGRIEVFAPFAYSGLLKNRWDLVIIEGWYGMVPSFIASIRRRNPRAIILYICLDSYPTPRSFTQLDVDGFLTNGLEMQRILARFAPTRRMQLAVDTNTMHRQPPHPSYTHNVVYLGHDSFKKDNLHGMLAEAVPFGLAIYGGNWNKTESELSPYYKGVLPLDDIAALYSSAKVVIGTTDVVQRSLGMVNNRVFEALACGAVLISDHFPALERLMGDAVLYARQPGDVQAHLTRLLSSPDSVDSELHRRSVEGQELIQNAHTWQHRVDKILGLYEEISHARKAHDGVRHKEFNFLSPEVLPGVSLPSSPPPPSPGSSGSHNGAHDVPPPPLLPPPMQRYYRPNRPLVVMLVAVSDLLRLSQATSIHATGLEPVIPDTKALVSHLPAVLQHPELQLTHRVALVPLLDDKTASPPPPGSLPACAQPPVSPVSTPLLDPSHPLHSIAHRITTLVAIGEADGLAASTMLRWISRTRLVPPVKASSASTATTDQHRHLLHSLADSLGEPLQRSKQSVVDLSPRTVLIPWGCPAVAADLATRNEFDSVVCLTANKAPSIETGVSVLRHAVSGFTRLVQLGPVSITSAGPVTVRALELSAVLTNLHLDRRANSWIDLKEPKDGALIALEDGFIPIKAAVHNFDIPGQGSWAVLVNGSEVMRIGDGIFSLDYHLPKTPQQLYQMLLELSGRHHLPPLLPPEEAGHHYVLRIQVRLRDGLMREDEVWRSPPVHVTVYSRNDPVSANSVTSLSRQPVSSSSLEPLVRRSDLRLLEVLGDGFVSLDTALSRREALPNATLSQHKELLSVGCFQGSLTADRLPVDHTLRRKAHWTRLYDPRCATLTRPDLSTEEPQAWMEAVLPRESSLSEQAMTISPAMWSASAIGPSPMSDVGLAVGEDCVGAVQGEGFPGHGRPLRQPPMLMIGGTARGVATAAGISSHDGRGHHHRVLQSGSLAVDALPGASSELTGNTVAEGLAAQHRVRPEASSSSVQAGGSVDVVPWDAQGADLLAHLPTDHYDGLTVHWGALLLPRGSLRTAVAEWKRALKPGAPLRLVEPDYRYHQTPNRRVALSFPQDPETPSPYSVAQALLAAGFSDVRSLRLDETALTDAWLAANLALDASDDVDRELTSVDPPQAFVLEALA